MSTSSYLKCCVLNWLLLGVGLTSGLSAPEKGSPGLPERWEDTIRKFEAADKTNPPPRGAILLVGGSNARRWTEVQDYFPGETVINRGFGGAHLSDVVYFVDRIVLPYAPKAIILNAGGNDLASGKSIEEVRDACADFAAKVQAALPGVKIYYVAIPPTLRTAQSAERFVMLQGANAVMKELADANEALVYIDLFNAFLDAKGQPRPELFVADGTHFTPEGQKILADLIHAEMKK